MNPVMVTFAWGNRNYAFDAEECRKGHSLIRLPSGEILRVERWAETVPPYPASLSRVTANLVSEAMELAANATQAVGLMTEDL